MRRSIPLRGKTLAYTVTPGHLTIRNDKGEPIASMFYTAYTIPSAGGARPVTFLFNGGPGSSTMWLHMGSFGPMKVDASLPRRSPGRRSATAPTPTRCSTSPISSSSTRRPPACRARSARPRPRTSSASTRISTPSPGRSSATSPNTAAGTAPSSSSAKATARRARRGLVEVARRTTGVQLNGIVAGLDDPQPRPVSATTTRR